MPGVPSGRGCEACRKQKKKCDLVHPRCGRCTRLGISCELLGERRYKFMDGNPASKTPRKPIKRYQAPTRPLISLVPSNDTTRLRGSFIATIQVKDPRYDFFGFIPFARLIPRRLGRNNALDAIVDAISVAHLSIRTNLPSTKVFTSYGQALRALRLCLDDPHKAITADTLATIYLIIVLQCWINGHHVCGEQISHAEILVHVLNAATHQGWKGEFEEEMLITIAFSVLCSSAVNPRIRLEPWLPRMLANDKSDEVWIGDETLEALTKDGNNNDNSLLLGSSKTPVTLELRTLEKISIALREPETHFSNLQTLYKMIQTDCENVHAMLCAVLESVSLPAIDITLQSEIDTHVIHAIRILQTAHSTLLCMALIVNAVLLAFNPCDRILVAENDRFAEDSVGYGRRMDQYRPLGAIFVPISLSAVVAVAEDSAKRIEAESMLQDYATDFKGARWLESTSWLKAKFHNLRTKLAMTNTKQPGQGYLVGERVASTELDDSVPPPPSGGCFVQ